VSWRGVGKGWEAVIVVYGDELDTGMDFGGEGGQFQR
jgi:hypothetical protein